jgi:hypothetical protein
MQMTAPQPLFRNAPRLWSPVEDARLRELAAHQPPLSGAQIARILTAEGWPRGARTVRSRLQFLRETHDAKAGADRPAAAEELGSARHHSTALAAAPAAEAEHRRAHRLLVAHVIGRVFPGPVRP